QARGWWCVPCVPGAILRSPPKMMERVRQWLRVPIPSKFGGSRPKESSMRRWRLVLSVLLLLLPSLVAAQAVDLYPLIDFRSPLNRQHPLNRAVVGAWEVLPGLSGGALWYNLAGPYHGTLTNMATAGGASGWGGTTRTGGYGEMRFDGSNDTVSI